MDWTYETLESCPVCGGHPIEDWDPAARLQKCPSCGCIVDNPRLDADSIGTFYGRQTQYDHWLAEIGARDAMWARRFRILAPWLRPGRLLDVGAGIGQFLEQARRHGFQVDGTELSPVAREDARKLYGIALRAGQLEDLHLEDGSCDVVTMFHVLEHVPFAGRTLAECRRLLSDEGIIVIAVPNEVMAARALLHRATAGLLGGSGRGRKGVKTLATKPELQEIHLVRFTPASLKRALETSGFDVLWLDLDPHLPPVGWKGRLATLAWIAGRLVWKLTGLNLYPTMMAVARKRR